MSFLSVSLFEDGLFPGPFFLVSSLMPRCKAGTLCVESSDESSWEEQKGKFQKVEERLVESFSGCIQKDYVVFCASMNDLLEYERD